MKKNLTFLTGIVFLITILVAGGCESETEDDPKVPLRGEVTIYLMKAFEDDSGKHLKMYDSNYPDSIVVDTLETLVEPGTKVFWVVLNDSGIKKLKKISPKDGNGNIMHRDASGFFYTLFTGKKKHIVPNNAPKPSDKEEYLIKFKYKDNKTKTVDPYLKIPPP